MELLEPGWEAAAATLAQNSFAQLMEPGGLEAAATSFGAGTGEFAGSAVDGGVDLSVNTDPGFLTASAALALCEF